MGVYMSEGLYIVTPSNEFIQERAESVVGRGTAVELSWASRRNR